MPGGAGGLGPDYREKLRALRVAAGQEHPAQGSVGANVSVVGGFVASLGKTGTFDWTEFCVTFKPEEANLRVACRLGFFGSTVTGKLWCDDMTLVQLRSAF